MKENYELKQYIKELTKEYTDLRHVTPIDKFIGSVSYFLEVNGKAPFMMALGAVLGILIVSIIF